MQLLLSPSGYFAPPVWNLKREVRSSLSWHESLKWHLTQVRTLYLHKSPWWHLTRLKGLFSDQKYIRLSRSHPMLYANVPLSRGYNMGFSPPQKTKKNILWNLYGKLFSHAENGYYHAGSLFSSRNCSLPSSSVLHRAASLWARLPLLRLGEFLMLWRITTFPSHHRAHPSVQPACEHTELRCRCTSTLHTLQVSEQSHSRCNGIAF